MNIQESFLTALDSLMANKLRAALTMLGVIIGVASVIALLAIGNGVSDSIGGELSSIGTNLLTITTNQENSDGYQALSLSDVEALSDDLAAPDVGEVAASVQGNQTVIRDGEDMQSAVLGVTANYFLVNSLNNFASGDGLTQVDVDTSARVAVIGHDVAEQLFAEEYPIGRTIKINGASYEVVGVLEASGSNFQDSDERVYIPVQQRMSGFMPTAHGAAKER
jgi:putative ABC transport system permease protein